MIVATAGHVDHGKTLLIHALTGVDTDRLPEEKQRGMTIDLGFAYLPIGDEPIGFIDVPGHERFIHNMLCGVAGIDMVLFILAADDGPMPQSREHLAILDLLEVSRGLIALTKIDRVTPARLSEVREETRALFANTSLRNSPIFPVSAITGEGVDALKAHLIDESKTCPPRSSNGNFRLAIDRCFSLPGAGLIVTGTAVSGVVHSGESVRVLGVEIEARVRSIHAQNQPSASGRAGQRCALNLSGPAVSHDLIQRGDWIVAGTVPEPNSKMDVWLRILPGELDPFEHWTPVHVHLAASDVTGRVALLEGDTIAPGGSALAQLALDHPIGALWGDRFVIRDQSAQRTIGGGQVIDIFPPARGRAKPERLDQLTSLRKADAGGALRLLLDRSPGAVDLTAFAANRNLTDKETAALVSGIPIRVIESGSSKLATSESRWLKMQQAALARVAAAHTNEPNRPFVREDVVLEAMPGRWPREAGVALANELARQGKLVRESGGVRLADHMPAVSGADQALWKKVRSQLEFNLLRPPAVHEIAVALAEDPKRLESFLARAVKFGWTVRVAPNRYFRPDAIRQFATIAVEEAAKHGGKFTSQVFRDRTGIGRTVAIEVLEYFDRAKFTRRTGDQRQIIGPPPL